MPLRAVNGTIDLIAPLIPDDEWAQMKIDLQAKRLRLTLPCCGSDAIMRVSKSGTKHFVHKRKTPECTWKPETMQHLSAKSEIVIACRDSGWNVSTEVSGEGWRADVLASKGKNRIAFEVQWSRQTLTETEQRQRNYKKSEVRGCWFFRVMPTEYSSYDLPMFHLVENEDGQFEVAFESRSYSSDKRRYPLHDFVVKLLTGKIRFCEQAPAKRKQKINISFWKQECWRCNRMSHTYSASPLMSDCGIPFDEEPKRWNDSRLEFSPEIRQAVNAFLGTEEGKKVAVGKIKRRQSKTLGESYMSFGCAHCDAILGDFYLNLDPDESDDEENLAARFETEIVYKRPPTLAYPHWCLPEHGEFCCGRLK